MYRLIILIVLLNIVDCKSFCRGPGCRDKRHRERHPEDTFRKLAHQIISMERRLENFCRDNMNMRVREVYDTDSYSLKYTIPEFQPEDFLIKVMHRALYVSAERWDPIGLRSFHDVKMLPDNLDSEEGSWTLQDGALDITFPYRTPIGTESKKSCGNNNIISYAVITVPMNLEPTPNKGQGDKPAITNKPAAVNKPAGGNKPATVKKPAVNPPAGVDNFNSNEPDDADVQIF